MFLTTFLTMALTLQLGASAHLPGPRNDTFAREMVPLEEFQNLGPLARAVTEPRVVGCPDKNALPILYEKNFIGARVYTGVGNEKPSLSCTGNAFEYLDGVGISAPSGTGLAIGSIYVHPGCTFYGYKGYNFQGDMTKYEENTFISKVPSNAFGQECNSGVACAGSVVVNCQQTYPDCSPLESRVEVAYCNNSLSDKNTDCTYTYNVGTSWSNEMANGMSVNQKIKNIMLAAFFKNFQDKLYLTDYNWGSISTELQGEMTEHENTVGVAAWDVLEVEQVQGTCGGTTVATEMLRNNLNGGNSLFYGFISIVLPIGVLYLQLLQ